MFFFIFRLTRDQAWGQSTRYFDTLVLEYRFCSTRRYSVLVLLKSNCTRTCTQVLLKIKVLSTSTYRYFTSTSQDHRACVELWTSCLRISQNLDIYLRFHQVLDLDFTFQEYNQVARCSGCSLICVSSLKT